MTINELKTGNIIINRGGYAGVVIKEQDVIIYQELEKDWLSDFNDDMTYFDDDCTSADIMEVYEEGDFYEYYLYDCLYQRDLKWTRPTEKQRRARERKIEKERMKREAQEAAERRAAARTERTDIISIIAQQFYGNRTGTEISRDEIGYFLHGCISREVFEFEDLSDMDLRTVHIPGAEQIVIVYDQTKENHYVNVEFPETYEEHGEWYREGTGGEMTMHVSCEIPEIGFKIHTRCFACRMDENGVLQSLQDDDYKQFIHYFPER